MNDEDIRQIYRRAYYTRVRRERAMTLIDLAMCLLMGLCLCKVLNLW